MPLFDLWKMARHHAIMMGHAMGNAVNKQNIER
jgi:hypothetical protein